jgi:glycosyltransferase involved in cell wall biosynthesis
VFSLGVPYSLLRKGFLRDNPFVDIYHFSNHNDYETAQHDGILPSCRLRYIPQGVNTNLFARGSKERGERLRSQYGISRLARVITSVGMFDESKNMQSLLDAVAGLDGDVHLVVFGQGGGRDLLGRARSLLGDAFHFHTVEQQRLADFLHATDVFVFPGMVEGFGRCIIEAASTGTPCLVHDDSWFSHLIPDACFRLDMRDARGLSQRIACCLGHMTEMRSRFTSVRDYALRQFDWTELVPRYVQELYVPRASASSRAGNG